MDREFLILILFLLEKKYDTRVSFEFGFLPISA